MGLKGMQFAPGHLNGKNLPTGAVVLGRVDCALAESFESAKSLSHPIDFFYLPQKGKPEDIASLLRYLVYRSPLQSLPPTDDWQERQPIFWPTGVIRAISGDNLWKAVDVYREFFIRENGGPITALPFLQFVSEILWRCCYIIESFRAMAPGRGLGMSLLSQPLEGLIEFARKGRCYWPWLGPDIALDVFIFENEILGENEPFKAGTSILVRMYGMGIRDLRFLQRNRNEREREEQLDTLHRCHILRAWLGTVDSADLTEQLEFCYYSMAASMKGGNNKNNKQKHYAPGMETHQQRTKARQREFKILKIMVDRAWNEIEIWNGRRPIPFLLRRRREANGQTREGDWHLLANEQRRILLGGQTPYHSQHYEHTVLSKQWGPWALDSGSDFFVGLNTDLYFGLPIRAADPTTLQRLEEFIDTPPGLVYHAPKNLEEFIEIHDYSVLERRATPSAGP
ncbi:hypothetical protein PG993_000679 [Apiospora rasikravindrae]|uniref:Uncharacterized protein n=1 Tax=Apiospora rasikravindrae TaxID=990691 RepID=A0ABR1U987_9PEZI